MTGFCGISARKLWRELTATGVDAELALAYDASREVGHVFVLACGYVLDVTASQFGESKVCVRLASAAARERWWWSPAALFDDEGKLIAQQVMDGWLPDHILMPGSD